MKCHRIAHYYPHFPNCLSERPKEGFQGVLLVKNEYNLPVFLDMIESWLRSSGIGYIRDIIDSVQTFVIQHDMGKRWSTYFEKLIKYVFKDLNESLIKVIT